MDVTLSLHEMATARDVGGRRQLASLGKGLSDRHGFQGDPWDVHIEGAGAEMAVAKQLNIYWEGSVNTFKSPDLPGIQVRRRSLPHYELLVRPCDSKDEVYVLVTGKMPQYRIHGWIRGSDAMQERWLKGHGGRPPAYFVPHSSLAPMEDLPLKQR
jgi:hypothetical protein